MSLGNQIAHYRKNKNITQDALAKQLGISNQAVSKWETNQSYPDVELLPKIADVFGITLDELFERKAPLSDMPSEETVASMQSVYQNSLPWENDESLHVVVFQGHRLVQAEELKQHFGKICKDVTFRYSGPALNIDSHLHVHCGNVAGNVTAGSYVECDDVGTGVIAGSYVECDCVGQNAIAGSYIECDDIGQNATAGSYIECGDVGGNVSAEGNVDCGDVGHDVSAGKDIDCGDVNGNVNAGGNVDCGDVAGHVTSH